MSKPARFPEKIEVWVPTVMVEQFEALAAEQLLTVSDHARQAFRLYLNQFGFKPRQPAPNSQEPTHV